MRRNVYGSVFSPDKLNQARCELAYILDPGALPEGLALFSLCADPLISPSLTTWLNGKGITREALLRACFVDGPGRDQLDQWESDYRQREWNKLEAKKGQPLANYSHSADLEARVQKQLRRQAEKFRYHSLTVRFLRGRFERHVVTYDARFYEAFTSKE